jgi:leader peptidase (prepilin peptidase)/N-methyltransferase
MIEALLALLFGLIIGSFLNVCIYRWPRDLSVVRPRSHCTSCDKTIAGYDNVPVFSFLLLRGRCRYCKARISLRYPIVELLTGALFFHFVYALGPTPAALKMCVLSALLVGLAFSDLEERILPDEFTKGGLALGFLFALFVPVPDNIGQSILFLLGVEVNGTAASVSEAAVGALLPAFFLWGTGELYFRIRHKEGLGFGDVKLIAMVGSFLGLMGALWTLIIGGVTGSILSAIYIKATGKEFGTFELPYGTFLGAAALVLSVWHKALLGI